MTTPRPLHLVTPGLEDAAASFRAAGVLADSDLLVVDAVAPRFGERDAETLLGLALAVRAPRVGHVGVDLRTVRDRIDLEVTRFLRSADGGEDPVTPAWPAPVSDWEERVLASPLVAAPADPEAVARPFVRHDLADGHVLVMSRRMWREQQRLAEALRAIAATPPRRPIDPAAVDAGLARLAIEGQGAAAVRTAALNRLAVVTGGPGTGKTYSIKRLLALLLEAWPPDGKAPLRIELAAPTGKAAVRMAEAMAERLGELGLAAPIEAQLRGLQPRTLHKLLGMRPDGGSRHDRERPIVADVIVVDEVSMVDLALMRRLVEAVPPGARLVLLGDRDQLASVEAGTVLSDIVRGGLDGDAGGGDPLAGPLAGSIVAFTESHRFRDAPTVARVALCLQRRDDDEVHHARLLLEGKEHEPAETDRQRVHHLGVAPEGRPTREQLDLLAKPYVADGGYADRLAAALAAHGTRAAALADPTFHRGLLDALGDYRVLAVHRRGPLGVSGLERELGRRVRGRLEQAIRARAGLPADAPVDLPSRAGHWLGRPVLVTENVYEVGLMNGDIGLVLWTESGLAAVFPVVRDGAKATRTVALARLPAHEGALAMTVHKSQGSQFRRVALVLADRDSPIQTRELVYTGVTRTSDKLDWLGDPDLLESALRRRVDRASSLSELLWRR